MNAIYPLEFDNRLKSYPELLKIFVKIHPVSKQKIRMNFVFYHLLRLNGWIGDDFDLLDTYGFTEKAHRNRRLHYLRQVGLVDLDKHGLDIYYSKQEGLDERDIMSKLIINNKFATSYRFGVSIKKKEENMKYGKSPFKYIVRKGLDEEPAKVEASKIDAATINTEENSMFKYVMEEYINFFSSHNKFLALDYYSNENNCDNKRILDSALKTYINIPDIHPHNGVKLPEGSPWGSGHKYLSYANMLEETRKKHNIFGIGSRLVDLINLGIVLDQSRTGYKGKLIIPTVEVAEILFECRTLLTGRTYSGKQFHALLEDVSIGLADRIKAQLKCYNVNEKLASIIKNRNKMPEPIVEPEPIVVEVSVDVDPEVMKTTINENEFTKVDDNSLPDDVKDLLSVYPNLFSCESTDLPAYLDLLKDALANVTWNKFIAFAILCREKQS